MYAKILGTGSYLPKTIYTNDKLSELVDTSDAWIQERTGIRQRHVASEDESISYMAYQASLQAIEAAGVDANSIDMIIVATTTPDHALPSVGCQVHRLLKIRNIPAFDVAAACSGFMYALSMADQFIKTGAAQKIMVIGADTLYQACDPADRGTVILFGDGAGAVLLGASETPGLLSTHISADGQHGDLLKCRVPSRPHQGEHHPGYIEMKGNEVFKVAVSKLAELVTQTLDQHQMTQSDIDWLIPHQANVRIIKAIAKKLSMDLNQVILTLDKHGNTSAASVPLALDQGIRDGRIQRGQTLLLEAFGGGLVWGSALVKY